MHLSSLPVFALRLNTLTFSQLLTMLLSVQVHLSSFTCIQNFLCNFLPLFVLPVFHYTASIKKLQEQNESHQVSRAKMAEGMSLALEKKDQVNVALSLAHLLFSVEL